VVEEDEVVKSSRLAERLTSCSGLLGVDLIRRGDVGLPEFSTHGAKMFYVPQQVWAAG